MLKKGNVVVTVSDRIGDAIFNTPSIHILKCNIGDCKIFIITASKIAGQVFENNPDVESVFVKPNKRIISMLAKEIECVINIYNNKFTRTIADKLGKPVYTISDKRGSKHITKVEADFICYLFDDSTKKHDLKYRLYPQKENFSRAECLLRARGASLDKDEILIGCHMSTHTFATRSTKFWKKNKFSKKSWPIERFPELGEKLHKKDSRLRLVLTGTKGEKQLLRYFKGNKNHVIDIMGETSVLDLAAMMKYFKAFITADTGPLHIASSTDVPIVAMFYSKTSPVINGPHPFKPWHHILHKETMAAITVSEVYEKVLEIIM
jgi:ADP-heptose:LPS heptosyltransferase